MPGYLILAGKKEAAMLTRNWDERRHVKGLGFSLIVLLLFLGVPQVSLGQSGKVPAKQKGSLFSSTPQNIIVPNILGLTENEAKSRLTQAGLELVRVISKKTYPKKPKSTVIYQQPAAGGNAPLDKKVIGLFNPPLTSTQNLSPLAVECKPDIDKQAPSHLPNCDWVCAAGNGLAPYSVSFDVSFLEELGRTSGSEGKKGYWFFKILKTGETSILFRDSAGRSMNLSMSLQQKAAVTQETSNLPQYAAPDLKIAWIPDKASFVLGETMDFLIPGTISKEVNPIKVEFDPDFLEMTSFLKGMTYRFKIKKEGRTSITIKDKYNRTITRTIEIFKGEQDLPFKVDCSINKNSSMYWQADCRVKGGLKPYRAAYDQDFFSKDRFAEQDQTEIGKYTAWWFRVQKSGQTQILFSDSSGKKLSVSVSIPEEASPVQDKGLMVEVPSCTNQTRERAIEKLNKVGLLARTVWRTTPNKSVDDKVFRSEPDMSEKVKQGSVVTLSVWKYDPTVAKVSVPNTLDFTSFIGANEIKAQGLIPSFQYQATKDKSKINKVLASNPPPDSLVNPASKVLLLVGKFEATKVPDVIGMDLKRAIEEIKKLGFLTLEGERDTYEAGKNNIVFKTDPPAGKEFDNPSREVITVNFYKLAPLIMPYVVAKKEAQAKEMLKKLTLYPTVVREPTLDKSVHGIVSKSDPRDGTEVKPGQTVRIYVKQFDAAYARLLSESAGRRKSMAQKDQGYDPLKDPALKSFEDRTSKTPLPQTIGNSFQEGQWAKLNDRDNPPEQAPQPISEGYTGSPKPPIPIGPPQGGNTDPGVPASPKTTTSGETKTPSTQGNTGKRGLSNVTVNSRNITISVWDYGKIDGDIINILVNGRVISGGNRVTLAAKPKVFKLTLNPGKNNITIYAVNEGSDPPNTASLKISNVVQGKGQQQYSINQKTSTSFGATVVIPGSQGGK